MKKKWLGILLLVAMVSLVFSFLTACDDNKGQEDTYYTVTFELDGGEIEGQDVSSGLKVKEGTELSLAAYSPKKDGFTFSGWKNGETAIAADGKITVNANITLTAQWTENEKVFYTVTFELNGGTMAETEVSVESGKTLSLAEYVPDFSGREFIGWKNGDVVYTSDETITVIQNMTLTAQWQTIETDVSVFSFVETADKTGYVLKGFAEEVDQSKYENIVLPGKYNGKPIKEVSSYAFRYCETLKSVDLTLCKDLETIGDNVFYNCMNLESVNLCGLSKLKTLGDGVFGGHYTEKTEKLQTVSFNGCSALESIGQMCFAYQDTLCSVDLSECSSLKSIGRQMFDNCSSLQIVKFPASLETIAENADFFRSCPSLESIEVAVGNLYFESENGVLYTAGKTEIIKYPAASKQTEYIAPASVTSVWGQAFENSENLTKIDFGNCTLSSVGFNAFEDCKNAELTVPFDDRGYYQNATQCELGKGWNSGVKKTVLGEKYYFFEEDFSGIEDGMTTAQQNFTFTAEVLYGEYTCVLTVKNETTGALGSGTDGSYSVALQAGKNTIIVTADCEEKKQQKTFTFEITLDNTLVIDSSLKSDVLNKVSDGFAFTVSVVNKDSVKVSVQDKISVAVDCGYSSGYTELSQATYAITFNADGTIATIVLDFETLLMWDYKVESPFHIKLMFKLSETEKLEAIYEMQYEAAPTFTVTGLDNNFKFNEDLVITVTAISASGTPITPEHIQIKMELWAGNWVDITYSVESNADGVYEIKLSYSSIESNYWNGMMEPFSLAIILTDESGLELARVEYTDCDLA